MTRRRQVRECRWPMLGMARRLLPSISVAVVGSVLAVGAPLSAASAQSIGSRFELNASGSGDYRIGPWSDAGSMQPDGTSLRSFQRSFGSRGHCATTRDAGTVVTWPAWGVRGEFTTLGAIIDHGHPVNATHACRYPAQIQADNIVVDGSRWHTPSGLTVGDSSGEVRTDDPAASYHVVSGDPELTGWWLHSIKRPWDNQPQGDLVARVARGQITSFVMIIDGEGE